MLGGALIVNFILAKKSLSYNIHLINDRRSIIWFMVPMSTQIIMKYPFLLGSYRLKIIDQGWVESSSAQGIFKFFKNLFSRYQP